MAEIEFYQADHVAHVRLNRPHALNAINHSMNLSLREIWREVDNDDDIWVVVLSGEGERAFCAGADLKELDRPPSRVAIGGGITGIGGELVPLKKPLIAAVHGHVLGIGFELAMCSDILIAADTAQFALPETRLGLVGESGVVHRAIRQLPYRVGLAMVITGDRLSAEEAARYGLANEIVQYYRLMEASDRWVRKILSASPLAVQAAKNAALAGLAQPLEAALSTRFEAIENYRSSADWNEAVAAFAERRAPQWSGR